MDLARINLRGLRNLDPCAWTDAYAELSGPIYAFTYRKLNRDQGLAKEVLQEVFLRAIESVARFRGGETSIVAWFFAIARNTIASTLRGERRWRSEKAAACTQGFTAPSNPSPAPDDWLMIREESEFLNLVVARLPEKWEMVLRWRYLEELSLRDIADRLNITPRGAESLVRRARNALCTEYNKLLDIKHELTFVMEESAR